MIVIENCIINGKTFIKTYSDLGYMIERDGKRYSEAIDPEGFDRKYAETDVPIDGVGEEISGDEFLSMVEEVL